VANWSPNSRQALYLLGDQFNRRPDSEWGSKLLRYKRNLREKHPEVVVGENGAKKYTDGHILKMALWRARSRFAEWLWKKWTALEERTAQTALPVSTDEQGQAAA
jgi:hypothetical protein